MLNQRNCLLITLDHLKLKWTFYTPVSCTLLGLELAGGSGVALGSGENPFICTLWGGGADVNGYSSLLNFSLCLSPGPFSVCLWLFVYLLLWVLWTLKKKQILLQNFQKDVYCNEMYFPVVWRDIIIILIIIIIINKHYEKMVRHKDFQAVLLNDLFQCYMSRPFTCCNNVFIFDIVIFYLHIIFAFYQLNLNFHLIYFSVFYHVTQSGQRWKNY